MPMGALYMATLEDVLSKYRSHPDFLGDNLMRADQRGAFDDTPLHIAAQRGNIDDIAVLIAHGADINLRGDLGNTPLHFAAPITNVPAIAKLLELGADPKLLNELSETPLGVAQSHKHDCVPTW
jgi:ankyrin repeat protein